MAQLNTVSGINCEILTQYNDKRIAEQLASKQLNSQDEKAVSTMNYIYRISVSIKELERYKNKFIDALPIEMQLEIQKENERMKLLESRFDRAILNKIIQQS